MRRGDSEQSVGGTASWIAFFGLFSIAGAIALTWAIFQWRGVELNPNFTATGLLSVGLLYLVFPQTIVRRRARTPVGRKLQSLMFYGMGGVLVTFGLGALVF